MIEVIWITVGWSFFPLMVLCLYSLERLNAYGDRPTAPRPASLPVARVVRR